MAPRGSHLLAELARAESAREPADGGGGNGGGGGAAADDGADGDGGGDVGCGGGGDEVAGEPLVGRLAAVAAVKVKNGETAGGPDGARGRAGGGGVRGAAALGFGAATAAACALRRASKTFLTASCCRWRSRDDFSLSTRFEEAACAAPRATRQGSAAIVLWMGGVRDSCGGAAFEAPAGAADAERESICSTARRWPMERASSSLATAALGRGRAADGAAVGVHSWRMYRA